jgi:adenylate cyclase
VAVNVLEDITLVNANNLRMTEQTLSVLANKKCRITGSIFLVNNISDPVKEFSDVVISFSTKELLVKKFGNIVAKDNELFVNFKEKAIYETSVSCQETIHLYLNPG